MPTSSSRRTFLKTLTALAGLPFTGCLMRTTPRPHPPGPGDGTTRWTPYWDYADSRPAKAEFRPHWVRLEWEKQRGALYHEVHEIQPLGTAAVITMRKAIGATFQSFRASESMRFEVYAVMPHMDPWNCKRLVAHTVHPV